MSNAVDYLNSIEEDGSFEEEISKAVLSMRVGNEWQADYRNVSDTPVSQIASIILSHIDMCTSRKISIDSDINVLSARADLGTGYDFVMTYFVNGQARMLACFVSYLTQSVDCILAYDVDSQRIVEAINNNVSKIPAGYNYLPNCSYNPGGLSDAYKAESDVVYDSEAMSPVAVVVALYEKACQVVRKVV